MPRRATRESSDTRARILFAAKTLFSERGSVDVTLAEVADQAGVSRQTIFNQLGSRQALVDAVTEGVFLGYDAMLELALEMKREPVPHLIRSLFQYMGAGIEGDDRFYRSVFREIARVRVGLDEGGIAWQAHRRAIDRLTHLLTRGQARSELRADHDPHLLAVAFDSLVFGTISHWLYEDDSEPLTERMLSASSIFLSPVATSDVATDETLPDLTVEDPLHSPSGGFPRSVK